MKYWAMKICSSQIWFTYLCNRFLTVQISLCCCAHLLLPISTLAEDAAGPISILYGESEVENKILVEFCIQFSPVATGTTEEKRKFWQSQFESSLFGLESDGAKALLYDFHADKAATRKDYVEAVRIYKILVDKYPQAVGYHGNVRELLHLAGLAGDHAAKLSAALTVEKLETESSKKLVALGTAASAYISLKKFPSAVEIIEELSAKFPDNKKEVLQWMNNLGVELMTAGQPQMAIPILEAAYSKTPPEERGNALLCNLASANRQSGRKEQSIQYLEETMRLFPEDEQNPSYHFSIATVLVDLKQYEEAKTHFQAVLDSDTSHPQLAHLKQLSAENLGNVDRIVDAIPIPVSIAENKQGFGKSILLVVNLVVVAVIAVVLWQRKKKNNATTQR